MVYSTQYYKKNKPKILDRAKNFSKKNPEKVKQYKTKYKLKQRLLIRQYIDSIKYPCIDCGAFNVRYIDFHHNNNKKYLISRLIHEGYSLTTTQSEIKKCICLCANCHRIRHTSGKLYTNKKGKYVYSLKKNARCSMCGYDKHWAALDFHHINPNSKILNIGAMIRDKFYSLDDIINEISKCSIICVNCHRII